MSTLTIRQFRTGNVHVEAVQLTEANGPAVWEWADSKPYFSPDGDGLTITGLRIYTPTGDAKAEFGDWVVRYAEGFYPVKADTFAAGYTAVGIRALAEWAYRKGIESVRADAEREWDKQEQAAHVLAEEPY